MDKDELNKFKWLDAQEVRPPTSNHMDVQAQKAQKRMYKKMVEFLTED